ncbi:rhodanese-like domain-containing protein 14 [Scenedesmus sp. PABB004]|nr:rhodanese-like domain-containing protein 14 [Scenedesmus sp. PABB004]
MGAAPRSRGAAPAPARRRQQRQQQALGLGLDALPAPDPAAVQAGAYWALGLGGASFVATFFVAPRFKAAFKEDIDWRDIYYALTAAGGVRQVDAADAAARARGGGAVLLDVRLAGKYAAGHAAGAVSAPLYLPIQAWDLPSIIRRAGFAFFGIYGTELNTAFAGDVQRAVPKGKQIILVCENGGSLENKSGTKFGFQSRSLKAAYYLAGAGYKNVSVLRGGLPAWARAGLPTSAGAAPGGEDDDDDDDGGGLPAAALRLPALSSVFSR